MTWFDTTPAIAAAVLIFFVPGLILTRVLGARGLAWVASSAPASVTLAALAAVAGQFLNVGWSVTWLAVVTLVLSAAVLVVRFFFVFRSEGEPGRSIFRGSPPRRSTVAAFIVGIGLAATIIGFRIIHIVSHPDNISQTYDNVFHLNAVRFILDTGRASSLSIGYLEPSRSTFYPAAWHDLVSLVASSTSVPIPVAINVVNIVIAALVWTISSAYLVSRILGPGPATMLTTGALAAAFSAFPYLLLEFGVLYPNFLAISILPAAIGLAVDALGLAGKTVSGRPVSGLLAALVIPGLGLSHPSVLLAFAAFILPALLMWLVNAIKRAYVRRSHWSTFLLPFAVVAIYLTALNYVWQNFRPSKAASFWPPTKTMAEAMGEALASAPQGRAIPYVVLGLTAVGIYSLVSRRRHWWLFGSFLLGCALYMVVSGYPAGDIRSFFTGVWYNDSFRLAAMLPVFALPIAALGAYRVFRWLVATVSRWLSTSRIQGRATAAIGLMVFIAISVTTQGGAVAQAERFAAEKYKMSEKSALLTVDERNLLERTSSLVPEDAVIIGNPGTGASLVYAYADRQTLLPAVGSSPSADEKHLRDQLINLDSQSEACSVVRSLRAYYVLDFGAAEINGGRHPFPTSAALAKAPGLKLIDHEGSARLYEVTACT